MLQCLPAALVDLLTPNLISKTCPILQFLRGTFKILGQVLLFAAPLSCFAPSKLNMPLPKNAWPAFLRSRLSS